MVHFGLFRLCDLKEGLGSRMMGPYVFCVTGLKFGLWNLSSVSSDTHRLGALVGPGDPAFLIVFLPSSIWVFSQFYGKRGVWGIVN